MIQRDLVSDAGEERRHCGFPRRHLFVWATAILFANQLIFATRVMSSHSIGQVVADLCAVGIFQYLAWYAIFCLLGASSPTQAAGRRDFAAITALCLLVFLPTSRMIWIAATGIAAYLWIFNDGDVRLRAAASVLAALSIQQLWGRTLFDFIAPPVLRAETAAVGTMLEATRAGTVWHDNVITGPTGYGIVIFPYCSAFHNVSLALLCCVAIARLRSPNWRRRDVVIGAVAGGSIILLNTARLYLMALDIDLYRFWHDGAGTEIFGVGASLTILLLCLLGLRPGWPGR